MTQHIIVDGQSLTIDKVISIACQKSSVAVNTKNLEAMAEVRSNVEDVLRSNKAHYGINTGFGALAEQPITSAQDLRSLQQRLIESHAVGVSTPLKPEQARAMMLLRLNTLLANNSGTRPLIGRINGKLLFLQSIKPHNFS